MPPRSPKGLCSSTLERCSVQHRGRHTDRGSPSAASRWMPTSTPGTPRSDRALGPLAGTTRGRGRSPSIAEDGSLTLAGLVNSFASAMST